MSDTPNIVGGQPVPTLADIEARHARLRTYTRETPALEYPGMPGLDGLTPSFKFELLQVSGTFKARGAFSNLLALDDAARARGVTCVSAGNHAVAVAHAAHRLGVSAKVVMIKTASPARVALCRAAGAEVVMADDGLSAFGQVRAIEREEGRTFVHPFDGFNTVLGTATLGHEWMRQAGALDAVVLPIGGGGLAAGVSLAVKLIAPGCQVFGVEPEGADVMHRSFDAGEPVKMGAMQSIADSLCAPFTERYGLALCRRNIDALVKVDDDALRRTMHVLFDQLKLAVEPACAAATAAVMGPLRERLQGKRVGILLCGTNTDPATFARHLGVGQVAAKAPHG